MHPEKKREKKSETEGGNPNALRIFRVNSANGADSVRFHAYAQQTRNTCFYPCGKRVLALVINGEFGKYIGHDFTVENDDFSRCMNKSNHIDLANILGSGKKINCGYQFCPQQKTINTVLGSTYLFIYVYILFLNVSNILQSFKKRNI